MHVKKTFYLTTTLPYVNAKPHVGHAAEYVRADVLARWKKYQGYDVFFNTGTDEHGQKILQSAEEKGVSVHQYVDEEATHFRAILPLLGVSPDIHFIRTTDPHHYKAAQEFWRRVRDNGYIYKKLYATKYCVGCELEKTDSELENERCPLHPNKPIEFINEENYFFKFSAFEKKLLGLYYSRENFVVPEKRQNEIESFVRGGLSDFSISRLRAKLPWGIPVPDDEDHVMYVWFDALINYISTLGWPTDESNFERYWISGTPTQYCGQDNLRQQSAMWQAMLIAAGLPNSHQILINGFITGEGGIKMSKSLGNTIDPLILEEYYGTDALRYYFLRHVHPHDGSPVSYSLFHETYINNLVNGLGNLVSRLLTLTQAHLEKIALEVPQLPLSFMEQMDNYRFDLALHFVWGEVARLDKDISVSEPFKFIKTEPEHTRRLLATFLQRLYRIGKMLESLLPETSAIVVGAVESNTRPANIFVRKDLISPHVR